MQLMIIPAILFLSDKLPILPKSCSKLRMNRIYIIRTQCVRKIVRTFMIEHQGISINSCILQFRIPPANLISIDCLFHIIQCA